jgi:hypothetical protein
MLKVWLDIGPALLVLVGIVCFLVGCTLSSAPLSIAGVVLVWAGTSLCVRH